MILHFANIESWKLRVFTRKHVLLMLKMFHFPLPQVRVAALCQQIPTLFQMYAVSNRFRETLHVFLWDRYYPSLSPCRWYINVQWLRPAWIYSHFWVFLCVSASFVSSTRLTMLISANRNAEILPLWSSLSQSRIFTEANQFTTDQYMVVDLKVHVEIVHYKGRQGSNMRSCESVSLSLRTFFIFFWVVKDLAKDNERF